MQPWNNNDQPWKLFLDSNLDRFPNEVAVTLTTEKLMPQNKVLPLLLCNDTTYCIR